MVLTCPWVLMKPFYAMRQRILIMPLRIEGRVEPIMKLRSYPYIDISFYKDLQGYQFLICNKIRTSSSRLMVGLQINLIGQFYDATVADGRFASLERLFCYRGFSSRHVQGE